ncbi:MAG: hypothetical protein ACREDS_06285, partial [Limisphaerales bacterium]
MSIFKKNSRLFGSSVQSGARRISLKVGNLVCAAIFASFLFLIFSGNMAKSANVLVNPGAETGDSTGWTFDAEASVESTNDYNYNGGISYPPTASNVLAHTGEYVFKTYQNIGGASTRIYQDIAAAVGSQ